ncbi:phostensin [Gastrophryne carolinensis]
MMEVPDWKFHLLERKRREEEESKRKEREEEDRLAKMPAWKREIILRRKAKAEALETKIDIDDGEQEEREKVDGIEDEEKESRVLRENIGPVQQNPFIQQEKQRRSPEYYSRSRPIVEPAVHRITRAEDIIRDVPHHNEVKEHETGSEDHQSPSREGRGRVSRLLSRFGGSRTEDENNDPCLYRINGEGDSPSKVLSSSPIRLVESETTASNSVVNPAPPSPSCHRAVTGNQTLTQETTHSSHDSPSSSCIDSEPAELSLAPTAMSGVNSRSSMTEEVRSFPFQLRPASTASPRQFKQTAQASPTITKPETVKTSPEKSEDGQAGLSPSRERGPSPSRAPSGLQALKRGPGESQAMQKRKGNTITVNPRKAAVCENGIAAMDTPPAKPESGKKRYPTVDEIKVIGGYLALSRSCLAKHAQDKKKMSISFPEAELERTFEYPSESSMLAEYGPSDEPEVPVPPLAQPEEDEEEESVLLGGILRRKALIVDESCKR